MNCASAGSPSKRGRAAREACPETGALAGPHLEAREAAQKKTCALNRPSTLFTLDDNTESKKSRRRTWISTKSENCRVQVAPSLRFPASVRSLPTRTSPNRRSRPPEAAGRVFPRKCLADLPGRSGRFQNGRSDESPAADVGERFPACRFDLTVESLAAHRPDRRPVRGKHASYSSPEREGSVPAGHRVTAERHSTPERFRTAETALMQLSKSSEKARSFLRGVRE